MNDNFYENFRQTCLLGRIDKALLMVSPSRTKKLTKKQKETIKEIQRRFSTKELINNESITSLDFIIRSYEKYWHQSLLNIKKRNIYEKVLASEIKQWLLSNFKVKATNKNCYLKLQAAIRRKQLNCITGRVSHLQELEIWKKETHKIYSINLLESHQRVKVVFMSTYLTYGWMDYATCGASKVGGWAKEKALFCNLSEYDLKSENFMVSYLTHEAQHFSDYKRFKKLDSFALEYRAKLAEIINSRRTTRKLISRFSAQSSKSRHSYHHYASYKLIKNLGNSVHKTPVEIRAKAAALLQEDSKFRKKSNFNSL